MSLSPIAIAIVVFAGALGGGLVGMALAFAIPREHLSDTSKETIRLGAGVVGTMTALILGFLVSSASGSLERTTSDLADIAGMAVLLDRSLANYGSQADQVRELVREIYAFELELLVSESEEAQLKLTTFDELRRVETLASQLMSLAPATAEQRTHLAKATAINEELSSQRWLVLFQSWNAIPPLLLAALIVWLATTFGFFGLFAPRNLTVVVALAICALSAATAVFLIGELNTPFSGWIRISPEPLQQALTLLGR